MSVDLNSKKASVPSGFPFFSSKKNPEKGFFENMIDKMNEGRIVDTHSCEWVCKRSWKIHADQFYPECEKEFMETCMLRCKTLQNLLLAGRFSK